MSNNQIYGVVLPVEIAQRARVVAAMQGTSRSRLMRDLLEKYLETQTACKPAADHPTEALNIQPQGVQHDSD
jgi:metal-responsive CopG/Arc/MetJ family transcriptional regulator